MKSSRFEIINQVKTIILKFAKPERIYLYGSVAEGENNETSDIDIAYDDPNFDKEYLIEEEIDKIQTLLKIDIKNIAKADERFKNRVKSTGKVLYSANKELRAEDALYNYEKAVNKFVNVVDNQERYKNEGFEDVYLDILVKRFEFTYEMAWKAIKRYLDFLGLEAKNPRMCFKEAYAQQIIKDEDIWLDMIEQRNLSSHVYDEYQIVEIIDKKEQYKQAFSALLKYLKAQLNKN